MGFYDKPEQRVTIKSVRLAADVPEAERTPIQVLRTDSKTFAAVVEAKRNRQDAFYATGREDRPVQYQRAGARSVEEGALTDASPTQSAPTG